MNDAPERIWVQWPYANKTYSAFTEPPEDEHDEAQTPYILDTPEALAKSPHVQALVKAAVEAERERCAGIIIAAGSKRSNRWINRAEVLDAIRAEVPK